MQREMTVDQFFRMSVEHMDLSPRTRQKLRRAGITNMKQLAFIGRDMRNWPRMGKPAIAEIEQQYRALRSVNNVSGRDPDFRENTHEETVEIVRLVILSLHRACAGGGELSRQYLSMLSRSLINAIGVFDERL